MREFLIAVIVVEDVLCWLNLLTVMGYLLLSGSLDLSTIINILEDLRRKKLHIVVGLL